MIEKDVRLSWRQMPVYFYPFILILAVIALFPVSPLFHSYPTGDASVYLYCAKALLKGEMVYRDVWDHKPPLIYLIDALGLCLGNWGVWILEFVSFVACGFVAVLIAIPRYGQMAAAIAMSGMAAGANLAGIGGDYTEEYAMIFQWLGILVFAAGGSGFVKGLSFGFFGGMALLLKPTEIAVFGAGTVLSCLFLLIRQREERGEWIKFLVGLAAGFTVPVVLVCAWIISRGAWNQFVDAVFHYNLLYGATSTLLNSAGALNTRVFVVLIRPGFLILAVVGYIQLLWRRAAFGSAMDQVELLLICAWPLEFFFAALPGKGYNHYLLTLLPLSTLLAADGVRFLISGTKQGWWRRIGWTVVLLCFLLGVLYQIRGIQHFRIGDDESIIAHAVETVQKHAAAGDSLLVWGGNGNVSVCVATGRMATTRFFFTLPLMLRGYGAGASLEFTRQVKASPPDWILDASANFKGAPSLDGAREPSREDQAYYVPEELEQFMHFVRINYDVADRVEPGGWCLYHLNPVNPGIRALRYKREPNPS